MKTSFLLPLFFSFFNFLAAQLFGQMPDTVSVKHEVDSLLQQNRVQPRDSVFWAGVLDSLRNRAIQFEKKILYREGLVFAKQAVRVAEEIFGSSDIQTAHSTSLLGNCYLNTEQHGLAVVELEKSLFVKEQKLGAENLETLADLVDLGSAYRGDAELAKAEAYLQRAKSLFEKTNQTKQRDYRRCLGNLAEVFQSKGDFDQSEVYYLEVKKIKEAQFGKESASYGATVHDMGNGYLLSGRLEDAANAYKTALDIFLNKLGENHPFTANAYGNLGRISVVFGAYAEAEKLSAQAAAIRKKIYGEESAMYASSLHELAQVYMATGRLSQAISVLEKAREILLRIHEEGNQYFGIIAANLGASAMGVGDFVKAEAYLRESVEANGNAFGKESSYYAMSLYELAEFFRTQKRYAEAEKVIAEELDVWGKKQNASNPQYASALMGTSDFFADISDFDKAQALLADAKSRTEAMTGRDNTLYVWILERMASLSAKIGDVSAAAQYITEANQHGRAILNRQTSAFSENELQSFLHEVEVSSELLGSILLIAPHEQQTLAGTAYDNQLFYKGFLLQSAVQLPKAMSTADDSTTQIFLRWKGYHRQLSQEYSQPIAERGNTDELENKANSLEKLLVQRVSGFASARQQATWQDVQRKLQPGEAAIEFFHFVDEFSDKAHPTLYAALLLRPDAMAPEFIPLFEEKQLDSLLQHGSERKADYVNTLYTFADRGVKAVGKPQKSLYELLWQPLEKELAGIKTVYFSPTGLLHRLNFSAIPTGADEMLADRFNLVLLKSTRQLVIPDQTQIVENHAVLFGGIDFEPDTTTSASTAADFTTRSRGSDFGFEKTDSTLRAAYPIFSEKKSATTKKRVFKKRKNDTATASRGGAWNYLPGTEKEIAAIEKLMSGAGISVQTHRGSAATEEVFKKIGQQPIDGVTRSHPVNHSPRILHLATHGYFFPDPSVNRQPSTVNRDEPVFKISDHPMLRSGLILAGGNAAWQGAKTLEGREDGILTAYEISQMNLSNTELVVLSACETGLGDISGNEGVYGLQRAFKIAGAKYLIMSLWQVPDKQTSMLMTAFYKKWLVEKMPIPEAFRAAQQGLREAGFDPYQWAGFVLIE